MAGSKKRKHVSIDQDTLSSQHDIRSYAKVRKVHEPRAKEEKCEPLFQPPSSTKILNVDKKRKRREEEEIESAPASPDAGQRKELNGSKRVKTKAPASQQETPSKKAAALFDRLELDAKVKPIPFALKTPKSTSAGPLAGSDSIEVTSSEAQEELDNLNHMNAAFLSALSLYCAHNGTSSAADVSTLLPMITKQWKKRTFTLDDLSMVLAMEHDGPGSFVLHDYGKAGIRLSRQELLEHGTKRTASLVEEVELKSRFSHSLKKRWNTWSASALKENRDPRVFLAQLPRAEIIPHESVQNAAPMFARGHQRLADIKSSQAAANADSIHRVTVASELRSSSSAQPQNRGTNLLDRVLAKQALTASLPAGPTKLQLERKAALHRIEDIARVLELLAAGRPRCSFSLQAVVQQLQQSLRNPISKDEVELCLDIMKKEITTGFVNVVKNGNVACVVITKGGRIGLDEIRSRVEQALT